MIAGLQNTQASPHVTGRPLIREKGGDGAGWGMNTGQQEAANLEKKGEIWARWGVNKKQFSPHPSTSPPDLLRAPPPPS